MSLPAPARGRAAVFRVNPVAKLAALVPLTVALLLTLDWLSAAVAVTGELALAWLAGLRGRAVWRRTLPLAVAAPLAGVTMLLYGQASGATYLRWGLVHVTEGSVAIGLATALRLVALGLPAVLLSATIDPTDLADGLAQVVRLPARFVLGALAGLRMVGLFVQDWHALELARRARGVADSGRLRRLAGQSLALLVLAIRRGTKLATAMEARGFDGPVRRTWARPSRLGAAEAATIGCGTALAALSVLAAVLGGTWHRVW